MQNLNSKGLRDTFFGRTVSARTQGNIDAVRQGLGTFMAKGSMKPAYFKLYFR